MHDFLTESYAVWAKSGQEEPPFSRQLDSVLADFLYYPEEEWGTFNYRPPENADLLGAWRNRQGNVFVFLLTASSTVKNPQIPDYRILVAGSCDFVRKIGQLVTSQKESLARLEKRELAERKAGTHFNQEIKNKSIERFSAIVVIFTVLVNAFSQYLRNLPPPKIKSEFFNTTYLYLIATIHIGALFLLLLIIVLAVAYLLRFGTLMVQRKR